MIFKERYKLVERIGKGGFAEVFKVSDQIEGKFYALKGYTKNDKDENINNIIENCKKEIEIMEKIKSKYVVKLKENFYDEIYQGYCIVMELCDDDLKNLLKKYKSKGLPLKLINKIFLQLNDVLKEMYEKNIVHRDLKPANILINYIDKDKLNFDIKLTDFGLSTYVINSSIHTYTKAGTKNYCAPEIETYHYNNKCDLWSLGVILYELYTNKYIFDSENNRKKGLINKTDNENINKLLKKLIQVDINKRIEWNKYFEDEFFKIDKYIGKEYYDNGELKFEGEYLNGERNGKGKEYYENGKLKFKGEYLNGKLNGKVKEYYYNGKLKFEGEYLNGERNGMGKVII